ncbi:Replication factor C large subunit [Candidatus Tiddalikarchaeum anstoanum]|nr:Replication factor C large subunit [Candidatus Tiddalikarchaeum anstoanum]
MNFVDKYNPKSVKELFGLDENVKIISDFVDNFKNEKKKAVLLVGPEGSGKTSSVYAVANSKGYDVIEVNASDKRNADNIHNVVGNASKQATLLARPKIILIDEIDGLYGNADRGGVAEINKVVKETYYPIIMTANDEYSDKLQSIKPNVQVIKFKKRGYWDVFKLLKYVCEKEGLTLSTISLKKIASLAQGDVRSALNDLQNVKGDADVDELFERAKTVNIFDVLKMVFKSKSLDTLNESLDNFDDLELKDVNLWIAENIINEYEDPIEVREAYDWASRADVFLGRIEKRQYWRFLVYAKACMTLGIGLSKKEMYKKFSHYQTPVKISKLFKNSKIRRELKEKALTFSKIVHCSAHKVLEYYQQFLSSN